MALVAGAASLSVGLPERALLRLPASDEDGLVQFAQQEEHITSGRVQTEAGAEPQSVDQHDERSEDAPAAPVPGRGGDAQEPVMTEAVDEGAGDEAPGLPVATDQPGRRPEPDTGVTPPGPSDQTLPVAEMRDRPVASESQPPFMPRADTAPSVLPQAPGDALRAPDMSAVLDSGPEMPRGQAEFPGFISVEPDEAPTQPPAPPLPDIESPLTEQPEASGQGPSTDAGSTGELDGGREQPLLDMATGETRQTADRPSIGEPATVLSDRSQTNSESRLPRIDGATAEAAADVSPLAAFAANVDVAADLPRLAVVLIDDGRGPLGPEALQAFPFPVSFAIDPSHPEAAQAAQNYRDLGFEVLALADLPEGASDRDVEVTLAGALGAVPQAVAILEAPDGGLQVDRETAEQVAAFLSASGHGLISAPNGLNTAQQIAARDGVPSTTLFRDFDSEGQDARVIRRFLDQGAFRARQEGAVVMLGRLRADTISALVLWGLQDRAQSVALVPVSVVLRETQGAD